MIHHIGRSCLCLKPLGLDRLRQQNSQSQGQTAAKSAECLCQCHAHSPPVTRPAGLGCGFNWLQNTHLGSQACVQRPDYWPAPQLSRQARPPPAKNGGHWRSGHRWWAAIQNFARPARFDLHFLAARIAKLQKTLLKVSCRSELKDSGNREGRGNSKISAT